MAPGYIEKDVVVNAGRVVNIDLRVKPLGAVAGVVENVSTDSLLKGVRVQLQDTAGTILQETTTGDDGAYRFAGLGAGGFLVKVFVPKGYIIQGDAERLVDVAAGSEARADFQLYRHGGVQGHVMTEDGVPMPDAEVSLVDSTGAVIRSVRTGADGSYTFPDVPVDKYKLRVSMPDAMEG